jgi:hypothetical protein
VAVGRVLDRVLAYAEDDPATSRPSQPHHHQRERMWAEQPDRVNPPEQGPKSAKRGRHGTSDLARPAEAGVVGQGQELDLAWQLVVQAAGPRVKTTEQRERVEFAAQASGEQRKRQPGSHYLTISAIDVVHVNGEAHG